MVRTQFGDTTVFSVHSDDAPTVYVNGTSAQPLVSQTDPAVRSLEREMGQLNWLNPYTGVVENNIMVAQADHVARRPDSEQALYLYLVETIAAFLVKQCIVKGASVLFCS
jgi:hypothetical protein